MYGVYNSNISLFLEEQTIRVLEFSCATLAKSLKEAVVDPWWLITKQQGMDGMQQ